MKPSKKQILIFIALIAVLFVSFAFFADAKKPLEVNYPVLPGNPPLALTPDTTLPQLLQYLFAFFVAIGGLIAFGSMVYAGFLFMTSGANPGLRAKAMGRIRQAMLGLVLLLSTYIILNTINPELVFLHAPGLQLKIPPHTPLGALSSSIDEIDYNSLRYGGVVVFEDANTTGATGRSETIFHDVDNFKESTYIKSNNAISAVKVLGDCKVELGDAKGPGKVVIPTLDSFVILSEGLSGFNVEVRKLSFVEGKKGCLGNSIKIFESKNGNIDAASSEQGAHTLLTNIPDLGKILFMPEFSAQFQVGTEKKTDNKISSLRFAFDEKKTGAPAPLSISLCDGKGYSTCTSLTHSTSSLSAQWDNKASSIRFDSRQTRQAGVIVYRDTNFSSHHEIFIASDTNLNPSIVGDDEISSLQIIGRYRVTLYEASNFKDKEIVLSGSKPPTPKEELRAWLQFDNTDPEHPKESHSPQLSSAGEHQGSANGIFSISDLGKYCFLKPGENACIRKTFSDKISSIKIEVPVELNNAQILGGKCGNDNFCEL